jgi:hypothetical protein
MGNLSQQYKAEIQEIFGEIYGKYIKQELQAAVDSEITAKLKTTADGISKQTEQVIRKEGERLSSKLKKGITDSIRAELLDWIKEALPKERRELDYERLTQTVTKLLDERKKAEDRAAFLNDTTTVNEIPAKSDSRSTKGLLIASLLLNILLLAFFLYQMLFGSRIPFF